jgi:putative ATP-dependent endonuclease of the OLD family
MHIKKVTIENYKCFKGKFVFKPNNGLNILVGDNEAGKSTILEAIHLALTGLLNGRYLKNELTQYLFNIESVSAYVKNLSEGKPATLPYILIEVSIEGDDIALFEGDGNNDKKNDCGISFKIEFDDKYQAEYEELVKAGNIKTVPIEYYDIFWTSFARQEGITAKSIPLKSALIDSSSSRYQNGSDIYISRIIRENLEHKEIVDITQAYRKMQEVFMDEKAIQTINDKIKIAAKISDKDVKLSVDLSSKNAWETSLMTYLDDIPFHNIGKGEQCIVKTKLALGHKKSKEANVILIEEPENHLSHTKLNVLIRSIKENLGEKQILISTHNSFVANKLGLDSLILLNESKTVKLQDLNPDTKSFFSHLSGYDTLRLILCKKAILVEGDSDELVIQKAYMNANGDKLPIENGIDVISVGTAFLRFLEVAEKLNKPVAVVTDNDGDVTAVDLKYENYLGAKAKANIAIYFDTTIDTGTLVIGNKKKAFNYNTLEPKFVKENGRDKVNKILGTTFATDDDLHKHMKANKTECALKIFETKEEIKFPQYILDATAK